MKKILMTGGNGFLGWHTRAAIQEQGVHVNRLGLGANFDLDLAVKALNECSTVIHIAGVNRGDPEEVGRLNLLFANQIAAAILASKSNPSKLTFANSIQAETDTAYGMSKRLASEVLSRVCAQRDIPYHDVLLPNLFGEHGQPNYNMVTSTFCHALARGKPVAIHEDREITLLHAQDAADLLIDAGTGLSKSHFEIHTSVRDLASKLETIAKDYLSGEMPNLADRFNVSLLNTFRSHIPIGRLPLNITKNSDVRGDFSEILRTNGGLGQFSFSTTVPTAIRGNHFHRRKIERFTILSGTAKVRLRKLFHSKVEEFLISSSNPVSLDMPTMWTHSLENIGNDELMMGFWTNDHMNINSPDTVYEKVQNTDA
jgi:UDP-2-acetamido-2,6-beta-L-arabino-hexul-4-ose reductase